MSRQGIINISRSGSLFSFRKRSKFAKMAEHFEYNHIPAQLSSIHNFRVKNVLCFRESLVILHLSRNRQSQFGLLDLRINKFLGVFGRQKLEFDNETLTGEISPDKSKCLIKMPNPDQNQGGQQNDVLFLYNLQTKLPLSEVQLNFNHTHFCFDPRFTWTRIAVTNYERNQDNSLSSVRVDTWQKLKTNPRVNDKHGSLYPYLKDLCYTKDGHLVIASILDNRCYCRERKTRNYRPIGCSIYVFCGTAMQTLHCIEYQRYTCTQHLCPVNYSPVFSRCGNRMGLVMNYTGLSEQNFVQVYKLPTEMNLQNMCRIVILQNFLPETLPDLPLPVRLINFLHFKPEYE